MLCKKEQEENRKINSISTVFTGCALVLCHKERQGWPVVCINTIKIAVYMLVLILACPTTLGTVSISFANSEDAQTSRTEAAANYDRLCATCHGADGRGNGPATPWLWPSPRDLTQESFRWVSQTNGASIKDINNAIRWGSRRSSMPGFADTLSEDQITALSRYIENWRQQKYVPAGPSPEVPDTTDTLTTNNGQPLWSRFACDSCHGKEGKGDGPAANSLRDENGTTTPPPDWTTQPMGRPYPVGQGISAAYAAITFGHPGTAMPAFENAIPQQDRWTLAAYSVRLAGGDKNFRLNKSSRIAGALIKNPEQKAVAGLWPGPTTDPAYSIFGKDIDFPGKQLVDPKTKRAVVDTQPGPPVLSSLSERQCGRCHAKQSREWKQSLHSKAGSPGLIAQLLRLERSGNYAAALSCQRCHAPLPTQMPYRKSRPNGNNSENRSKQWLASSSFSPDLRREGLNCASCHIRDGKKYGPPKIAATAALSIPNYSATELPVYERSDFCIGCHQLPPNAAVNGKPLLNTYKEWLEGPYMKRGIQCQHCHMPNREHTWLGIHDKTTVTQAMEVSIHSYWLDNERVQVDTKVTNVGAGHYLPTTPTPAIWMRVELLDQKGNPIPGASKVKRIGRHIRFRNGWQEIEDTRIKPGESAQLIAAWKQGNIRLAKKARVTITVAPDDYYEGLYRSRLKLPLDPDIRTMFEAALKAAENSHFTVVTKETLVRPNP